MRASPLVASPGDLHASRLRRCTSMSRILNRRSDGWLKRQPRCWLPLGTANPELQMESA